MSCNFDRFCSSSNDDKVCPSSCQTSCPDRCKSYIDDGSNDISPPSQYKHTISTNLIIMACVLGGAFLFGVCWILLLNFYSKWKNSRRVNSNASRVLDHTHENFIDGNHRPLVEHHIWYINTVGLQQSVIDSINLCKFKKNEGLIEGTECSVCLSEFEEDETLRLLPKCNHAFHVPCIDTWLRSHQNCPMCRAPIVNESTNDDDVSSNSSGSGSNEDTRVEILDNHGEFGSGNDRIEEGGVSEVRYRTENFDESHVEIEILKKNTPYFDGVSSDSTYNHRVSEQEVQQMRRSVSLDSSSASVIYHAMANVEGCEVKNSNSRGILAKSGSSTSRTSSSESSSVYKLIKKPIIMKKSFSTNGKLLVPKHRRNQTSTLPF